MALRFAGLNHLVWVHQVLCRGQDVTAGVIEQLCEGQSLTMNNIKEMPWSPAFLRALQAIPCPYHRYYWQTPQMLAEEQEKAQHGQAGTRAEQVMKVEAELFALYADAPRRRHATGDDFLGAADWHSVDAGPARRCHRAGVHSAGMAVEHE
ncbi:hypothetical protein E05_35760 [Plautia stali symbiont]|nr:hypothetical protein E05_35760 [Plautia stali symbiont]